ncbi:MAG: LysM peptidoglycan-binding domain-containing protein [Anaerolineales bacterium]
MKSRQNVWIGILIWITSLGIVLGSLVLALSEGGARISAKMTATTFLGEESQVVTVTMIATATATPTPHTGASATVLPTSSPTPLASATIPSSPTYTATIQTSPTHLATETIPPTSTIISSPTMTMTSTLQQISKSKTHKRCNPPANWVLYQVHRGETLFNISWRFNISIAALQKGNCLGSTIKVKAGRKIYVPRQPIWYFAYPSQQPPSVNKNQKVIPPPLTPIPVTPRP